MVNRNQQLGEAGEAIAARYLQKKGYRILERNYRNNLGEIDIIAKDRGVLVFVEVKSRTSGHWGHPKSSVTPAKQRKISMVALAYLKSTGQTRARARFDVVTVRAAAANPQVDVITNAFELAYI